MVFQTLDWKGFPPALNPCPMYTGLCCVQIYCDSDTPPMLIFDLKSLLALKSHVAQPHLGWFFDNTNQNNKNGLIVLAVLDEFWVNKNRVDSVATLPQSLGILSCMEEHASIKSKNITIPIRINIRTCGILRCSNTRFWTYNFLCMSKKLIEYSLQRKLTLIYVAIEKYTSP